MTLITGPNGSIYADKERRMFKEPIGPVLTDDARPLINERILDVARGRIYNPDGYADDRARLLKQLTEHYMDGQIRIPYDHTEMTYEMALEAFVDDAITEKSDLIESGIDRSLFDVQLASIRLTAEQLENLREHNQTLEKEKRALRDGIFDAHMFLSTILTPEQLYVVDQKLGFIELVNQSPVREQPQQSFESVIEKSHGMPAGFLDKARLVKPPQSAEVELIDTERYVI